MSQTSNNQEVSEPVIFSTAFIFGADELALGIRNLILNAYMTTGRFTIPLDELELGIDNPNTVKTEREVLDTFILSLYSGDINVESAMDVKDLAGIWEYLGELDPHHDLGRIWLQRTTRKLLMAFDQTIIEGFIRRMALSFSSVRKFQANSTDVGGMSESEWCKAIGANCWLIPLTVLSFSPEIIRFTEAGQWKREF